MSQKGYVGAHLLTRGIGSVRQRHATGPMYHRRKHFRFNDRQHFLHKKISAAPPSHVQSTRRGVDAGASSYKAMGYHQFEHLPGDVRRRPDFDFRFGARSGAGDDAPSMERVDGVECAWEKRGNLQLFRTAGGKRTPTFSCFRCGYPVRSRLVAVKADNWDWRMCYSCYTRVVNEGSVDDI